SFEYALGNLGAAARIDADRAEQNRIMRRQFLQRRIRQRLLGLQVIFAAERVIGGLKGKAEFMGRDFQKSDSLGNDFLADSVAGHDCAFHGQDDNQMRGGGKGCFGTIDWGRSCSNLARMKAWLIDHFDGIEKSRLADVPEPSPQIDEVLM